MIDTERIATYQQLLDDIRKKKKELSAVIDPLIEKLEALTDEEKVINRLMARTVTPRKAMAAVHKSAKRSERITEKIISMLDTGEFSVQEVCEQFGLDNESYRSNFSQFYGRFRLGRRSFLSGRSYFYKYATESWYKSQGITDYALHKNWLSEPE